MKQIIIVLLVGLILAVSTPNFAQQTQEVIEKKVMIIESSSDNSEKNVWISKDGNDTEAKGQALFIGKETEDKEQDISINVNKEIIDGIEVRSFEVTIKEKGNEEVITWEDNGSGIPADIKSQLEARGLDIQLFESNEEMTVTVDASNGFQKEDGTIDVKVNSEINNGVKERTVELTIEENGNVQKMKWLDNGEVPEDVKHTLDELGVDVEVLTGGEGAGSYDIEIEKNGDHAHGNAAEKIVKVYKIELDEEEGISNELREELEQYGVDIDQLMNDAKAKKTGDEPVRIKKQIKIEKKDLKSDNTDNVHIIKLKDGEELPDEVKQVLDKYNIKLEKAGAKTEKRVMKIKDDNGNVKVLEWDGEGEMPAEMKKHMEKMKKGG